jgi:C4-dicarboxylate transporter DctQ subunit
MKKLISALSVFVGTVLLVAVAINFCNVFGRYALDKPIFWAEEAMGFLQVVLVVLGAALVTRDNAHLRMDAAEHLMPAPLKRWIDAITGVLTVAVALTVAWTSARVVAGMLENDQRSMGVEFPLGIPYAAFPIGFTLIALFAFLRVIGLLRGRQ